MLKNEIKSIPPCDRTRLNPYALRRAARRARQTRMCRDKCLTRGYACVMKSVAVDRDEDPAARELRMALVDELCSRGTVRSAEIETALRAVPRHLFLPGVSLEQAYANDAVVTKTAADGSSLSLASQPGVVAMMLEQL